MPEKTPNLYIGKDNIDCDALKTQLQAEIDELFGRISLLKRNPGPNANELKHLEYIINHRQAVLEWLDTSQ